MTELINYYTAGLNDGRAQAEAKLARYERALKTIAEMSLRKHTSKSGMGEKALQAIKEIEND